MFATYGSSAAFVRAYNALKDSFATAAIGARTLTSVQFRFTTPTTLTVRVVYNSPTSTGLQADYDFTMAVSSATGVTTFTKTTQGTGTSYNNAANFTNGFAATIQAYLTSGTFVADWIPVQTPPSMYTKTGGFTKTGEPTNYFYGTLGQTL
ncbi:hypothetical protein KRR40_14360 [Niabella defluvii]|nr:hypothetical protein KRR40_14360 [Niabella sp. I65]